MASNAIGISRMLSRVEAYGIKLLVKNQCWNEKICRNIGFFVHKSLTTEHNEKPYEYEITRDPKEWEFVEKLMPLETVPKVKPKSNYPSGWRPMREEALKLPYFIERTKNHMLPIYYILNKGTQERSTKISKIHGDIWHIYDELKAYIEEHSNEKVAAYVHEGNNSIHFRGDYVYYAQQWALSKGF